MRRSLRALPCRLHSSSVRLHESRHALEIELADREAGTLRWACNVNRLQVGGLTGRVESHDLDLSGVRGEDVQETG
jgi:hypothetical protein